jgi:hypothetical protein
MPILCHYQVEISKHEGGKAHRLQVEELPIL